MDLFPISPAKSAWEAKKMRDFLLFLISFPIPKNKSKIKYIYLVPKTSTLKWLFQLDDSKPLLGKWMFDPLMDAIIDL